MSLRFGGASGQKPSDEAKRYVVAVAASMIESELKHDGQWLFDGLDHERDRRLVRAAARRLIDDLVRLAKVQMTVAKRKRTR